jgi:hypothetical protein
MPRALWNSSTLVYASCIPDPGMRMVANDIQKAPYEVKAVVMTLVPMLK